MYFPFTSSLTFLNDVRWECLFISFLFVFYLKFVKWRLKSEKRSGGGTKMLEVLGDEYAQDSIQVERWTQLLIHTAAQSLT